MKTVKVTYFKPKSGKYYIEEEFEISEELNGYEALKEIPKHLRLKDMIAIVSDSDDGKEPYIVPNLYHPTEEY